MVFIHQCLVPVTLWKSNVIITWYFVSHSNFNIFFLLFRHWFATKRTNYSRLRRHQRLCWWERSHVTFKITLKSIAINRKTTDDKFKNEHDTLARRTHSRFPSADPTVAKSLRVSSSPSIHRILWSLIEEEKNTK